MTSATDSRPDPEASAGARTWWPDPAQAAVIAALSALAIPTLWALARDHWTTDNGAQGPIILLTGAWLWWRERATIHWQPGSITSAWLLLLIPILAVYVAGRALMLLGTQTAAIYAALVLLGLFYFGVRAMRRMLIPVLYLGFLVKPAEGLVQRFTGPLQIALSRSSSSLFHALGYPVGQQGVRLQIAQYELLVSQACAGLGSMFSLLAVGILYVHLAGVVRKGHRIALLLAIVPIAVAANFIRIAMIILLTYHAGDAVAQSFAHQLAGLSTFLLSLAGLFAFDSLLHLSGTARR